jgi:hypothetical protein
MEFLQSSVKRHRLQQKIAGQNQGPQKFQRIGRTPIPGGEFPVILRFSKIIFLNIKIRHRQSQTMLGWTNRFHEVMIKKLIKSSNICLLFLNFCVALFYFDHTFDYK